MARSQRPRRHRRVREAAAPGYAPEAERRELTGVLLDTNIIIEFLRGRGPVVDAARSLAAVSGLRLWTLNRKHYPMDELRFYEPSVHH